MKKLLILIILGAGVWYWQGGKLPFASGPAAVDASGNPQVWVFTFKGCGGPCNDALSDLKNRGVAFTEKQINPDDSSDADVQIWRSHGKPTFPLILVGNGKTIGFSRPELAALLAENLGDKALHESERRYFKKHFNSDGSPRIVMYGADWCGYCDRLRKEFVENNVDFTEIDVEKSGEKMLMANTLGIRGYPTTWVGYRRVNGSNLSAVKRAFD